MFTNKQLAITLAQLNWTVGDIEGNAAKMAEVIKENSESDLILFSELALSGSTAEDLLFRPDFNQRCETQLSALQELTKACESAIVIGHPHRIRGELFNAVSVFHGGDLIVRYLKQALENSGSFDEERYFKAGQSPKSFNIKGFQIALMLGNEVFSSQAIYAPVIQEADIILALTAQPYQQRGSHKNEEELSAISKKIGKEIVFLNQVGGQDELIFEGSSFICNRDGKVTHNLPAFKEACITANWNRGKIKPSSDSVQPYSLVEETYQALVLAVRDYVRKNRFKGALLGLSGGIDSAITLAIAVDALGKENVQAVMMPFRYTSEMSIEDAQEEAKSLGVKFDIVSIEPMFESFMAQLEPLFDEGEMGTTQENLQSRCRAIILMALSNKSGRLVLTTGNKSETAVGYSTLYGDTAGGFAVLKDVPKTFIYELAKYRNTISKVIPKRVIERAPSAELAPDQKDEDTLPPYPVLDAIIAGYVEQDLCVEQLVALGYDEDVVRKIIRLIDLNEYKRRQSPIGPKITSRSFGIERRYPITSGFGRKNW